MRLPPLAALLFLCVVTPAAKADTVYSYTGQPFTVMEDGDRFGDRVTGSFTLAHPLADNLSKASFSPDSFSFSDGVHTVDSSTIPVYAEFDNFDTDVAGNVTHYNIYLAFGDENFILAQNVPTPPFYALEVGDAAGINLPSISIESRNFVIGSFTTQETTVPPSATPEPSSFALLATGLLGVIGAARRRFA